MTKYKLVPVEPTPEMVEAAEAHMPFADMELVIRMAILEAPVVEQEPVAYLYRGHGQYDFVTCDHDRYVQISEMPHLFETRILYATPQPVEQNVPVPWSPVLKNHADGVDGHYAIGRFNPSGYWEFWNLISHKWASASDEVLTLDEANSLLREITLSTGPAVGVPALAELAEALEEAKLTLELLQGKGSSAKLTLSIIERALAAYRNGGKP